VVSLDGKTVLVTGASRGIGAACVRELGAQGATVIAHYGSHREGAQEAVSSLPAQRRFLEQADMAEAGAGRRLFRAVGAKHPRIDAVVVNAAMSVDTPFDGTDDEWDDGWERTLRVNVLEPVNLIREAVAHFRASGGGILITLSSWAAQQGSAIPQLPAYSASKAAVKAVTQTVARAYGKENVFAYVIAPGIVKTRMSEVSIAFRGGEDQVNAALALGRMVPVEEIGSLVAYLASGACTHLTGATLDLNGATYVR
jgi:NAD(P)-dependent dehydrogenase (short-subunit alcohol dehydrogenase family)